MKRNMKFLSLIILFSVFLFAQCEKDKPEDPNNNNNNVTPVDPDPDTVKPGPVIVPEFEVLFVKGYDLGFRTTSKMDTVRWSPGWLYSEIGFLGEKQKYGDRFYTAACKNIAGSAYTEKEYLEKYNSFEKDSVARKNALYPRVEFVSYVEEEVMSYHGRKFNIQYSEAANLKSFSTADTSDVILTGEFEVYYDGEDGGNATTITIDEVNFDKLTVSGTLTANMFRAASMLDNGGVPPDACPKARVIIKFKNIPLTPKKDPFWYNDYQD